jgi:hypothetical protein
VGDRGPKPEAFVYAEFTASLRPLWHDRDEGTGIHMTIVTTYQNDTHTRRLVVHRTTDLGWDVSEELDTAVVTRAHYADWHRVERARQRFALGVPRGDGWTEVRTAD